MRQKSPWVGENRVLSLLVVILELLLGLLKPCWGVERRGEEVFLDDMEVLS
jgi:hypothetical protein